MPTSLLAAGLDSSKPVGSRLSAQMIAEIQAVAPSAVVNNSITTAKMRDGAITTAKIAAAAVDTTKIAAQGVETANIKDAAVTTSKVADGAITRVKAGVGLVVGSNVDGSPASFTQMPCTALEYAALTPAAGVFYYVLA